MNTVPWVTGGPVLVVNEWMITYAGLPQPPNSITIVADQIRLISPFWINQGLITRVVYTQGPVHYTNDEGGVLQSFDLPFPFP